MAKRLVRIKVSFTKSSGGVDVEIFEVLQKMKELYGDSGAEDLIRSIIRKEYVANPSTFTRMVNFDNGQAFGVSGLLPAAMPKAVAVSDVDVIDDDLSDLFSSGAAH